MVIRDMFYGELCLTWVLLASSFVQSGCQVQGIQQTLQNRLMCDLQLPCERGTAQGVQNFGSLNVVDVVSANWEDDDLVINKHEHVVT